MNTPPEVMSMGSPEEYHDPGPNFDLLGQQHQAWKDGTDPTAIQKPNGGYKREVKEEAEEEEESGERVNEEYEKGEEEEEEYISSSSAHSSEDEGDADEENEEDHSDRESSRHRQHPRRVCHTPEGEIEHYDSQREQSNYEQSEHIDHGAMGREDDENIDDDRHTVNNDDDDRDYAHRKMHQCDVEEEDDEEEEEDEDDEEDRIKETQKLVAKIEHDIQGLRFQAKQRGHLLSDLHRYGAQNQQRRKEQEQSLQSAPVEHTEESRMMAPCQPQPGDDGKIIERPVSIKLRLRTRSTSPKSRQERYTRPPVVKAKPGKVKGRSLRIGNQLGRWEAWKESLGVKADRDLAKVFMDHMDKTYFRQFLPPPKQEKGQKRKKKKNGRKHDQKEKKPKRLKVIEEPEEWVDGYLDDEMDDFSDPVEEKDDYDYDPAFEVTNFGAYKPSNPVRNKRKSQKPRKLMDVNSTGPKASRPGRPPKRSPKTSLKEEEEEKDGEPQVVHKKKRERKPKPKTEVIKTRKKSKAPRIHRGGRRPSLMSTLRNLDWNALPRRYECKICCLRIDGIDSFKSHLESTHTSEYLKPKDPSNHKEDGAENSNDVQEAEKHFHGSEKQYQESEKQYDDLGHLPDQHSTMQESEQRRMVEGDMYRTMAYGQDMMDARRFEMMPPFKRHLHESYSNEWGKMQGNMYSRPLAPGQMMHHGEQSWGHNRGYDPVPAYRKHYEDGREWGKGGGQYPHVITSLGQNMPMGIDGGDQRQEQHGEDFSMQGGNMMGIDHAPSQDNTYVDMSIRQREETPSQENEGVSKDSMGRDEQEGSEQRQEGEPPPLTEDDKEAEDETNEQEGDDEEEEEKDGDENNLESKEKKKKTKACKEWEEIDRWAITFVHCPQCDDYIRFRPGQKNFHFAVHAERRLCQECGKMFTKEAFRAHVRVHQAKRLGEELKHICEVCGKAYRFKCSLSSHMRCHSGVRDFDCKICGKKFLSAHGLEKHELVHRKVKPHLCPDCGRGFTQYHNMLAHRRQHTGEKPYRCNCCDRSFTHNVSLKNHKKKEHGVDLWAETGGKPPSSNRQRSKSSRSAPLAAPISPPAPQLPPPVQSKPPVPNERELMHTLDPAQLYNMMPTLDYGHY